jgi:hypothetical protein
VCGWSRGNEAAGTHRQSLESRMKSVLPKGKGKAMKGVMHMEEGVVIRFAL